MNIKETITGKTVVIPSENSNACGSLIVDVLEELGAIVCHGSKPEDFRHNAEQLRGGNYIVLAEAGLPVEQIIPSEFTPGGILWFFRGSNLKGEKPKDAVDIADVSANEVAQKVAELINESKFKLPEWFEGYNFRYEGSVVEHPITKESCRTIRLFKTFEEGNIREIYAQVYLDEQGQLFTVSMEKQALPPGAGRFTVAKKEPSKKILTADSEIEVKYIYQERPVGETHHETENVSFFKTTES